MKYYKVKKECDNKCRTNWKKRAYAGIWVGNELYTEKELEKLYYSGVWVPCEVFDVVEIPKSRVFWMFGARFEKK